MKVDFKDLDHKCQKFKGSARVETRAEVEMQRCVLCLFLKVLMVPANQVEVDGSFCYGGTERVKVLESDFVPLCPARPFRLVQL